MAKLIDGQGHRYGWREAFVLPSEYFEQPATGSPVSVKVWTGSAWVAKPLKVWTGSAWVVKAMRVYAIEGWTPSS